MGSLKEITPVQWLVTVVVIAGIAAAIYFGWSYFVGEESDGNRLGVGTDTSDGEETQLITVMRGDLINSVAVNGSLAYANREELSFGFAGNVGAVMVEQGDRVLEGDVLATLDAESVVSAEQGIREASVVLRDAEDALDELLNPAPDLVADAELTVLEAQQSIDAEAELLEDLLNPDPTAVEAAKVKVLESQQAETEAIDALEVLFKIDTTAIHAAELKILESEKELQDALDALESEPSDTALKLSQARADIAAGELELHNVEEELLDAVPSIDPDEEKELELSIQHAEVDVDLALAELERVTRQVESKVGDADAALAEAREAYDAVFEKWLGLDAAVYPLMEVDDLLESLGTDLDKLFAARDPSGVSGSDEDWRVFTLTEDDPRTPWNEAVIESWAVFYPGELFVECDDHLVANSSRFCVRREFEDAWEPIPDLLDTLETVHLDTPSETIRAEETLKKAEEALAKLKDDLAELREPIPIDEEVIDDLTAKRDLAEKKIADASYELKRLTNELIAPEGEKTLGQLIALDKVTAAQDALDVAHETLSELTAEPAAADVELAEANIELAAAERRDAQDELEEMQSIDEGAVELSRQKLVALGTKLNNAADELENLLNPDEATVDLRRAEVAVARESYDSAKFTASDGVVRAPFDGIVSIVNIDEGQSVNTDTVAFEIVDPSVLEIAGNVDEIDILFLQVGDDANITLEAFGDDPLAGRVSEIASFGESEQGVVIYPVTIQMSPPSGTQLPEGLSAVAEVVIREEKDVLLIPIQALFGSVDEPVLQVVNGKDQVELRPVTLGIEDDFWVVVESGVSEGETIMYNVVGSDTGGFGFAGPRRR